MSLYSEGVRVGLLVCRVVRWHCHKRGFSVLDVPFVKRELAKVRLTIGEWTRGSGNGSTTQNASEGNLDIAVAFHADGDTAVKVVRVEKRYLVHVPSESGAISKMAVPSSSVVAVSCLPAA